jgi:hypothetical protein
MKQPIPKENGPQSNGGETSLELHSRTDDTPYSRKIFEGQIRESYGKVVYTHKTQEKCADLLLEEWGKIKIWQIAFSALSAGGFIAAAFGAKPWAAVGGALVSTALLALNTYTKNYDHGQLAQKHKQAAAALWMIRERYFTLIVDIVMGERPIEALQKERDLITSDLGKIYEGAPPTTSKAYARAQDALKNKEDLTFSDAELDAFLPKALKSDRPPPPERPKKIQGDDSQFTSENSPRVPSTSETP